MFLVTSIAMLRERTTGTLERLMSMPLAKLDLLAGYALAFAVLAVVQAASRPRWRSALLDLQSAGSTGLVVLAGGAERAARDGARTVPAARSPQTEFQAVQFMPAFVLPQLLLCGLLVPRDSMSAVLRLALGRAAADLRLRRAGPVATGDGSTWRRRRRRLGRRGRDVASLALGATTLRRRTP